MSPLSSWLLVSLCSLQSSSHSSLLSGDNVKNQWVKELLAVVGCSSVDSCLTLAGRSKVNGVNCWSGMQPSGQLYQSGPTSKDIKKLLMRY